MKAPATVIYSNPTNVSGGTVLDEFYIGGMATVHGKGGGIMVGIDEFVLQPETNYIYKVTNKGTGAGKLLMRIMFYEV